MLFQRSKIRRYRRTRDAEQATDWLATVAEHGADAVTAPTRLDTPGHLPPPRYAHVQRTPFGRSPRPRRRVIELHPDQTVTQQIPRIPAAPELKPVPAPLQTRRAPQPATTALTPVAESQQLRGGTWIVKLPAPLTYAERMAAVFAQADKKLTLMSGWVFNRTADDVAVTQRRFAVLDGAIAALGAI